MSQPGRHRASPRRWLVLVVAVIVGLLALGVYFRDLSGRKDATATGDHPAAGQDGSSTAGLAAQADASSPTAGVTPGVTPGATPGATTSAVAVSAPVRLRIASIGVDTALQPLGLVNGSLQSPSSWNEAGWYDGGVYPGQIGPAVIAGHVDSVNGPAVFYRLRSLAAGDQVSLTEQNGTVLSFVVDDVQSYPKDSFPSSAVYGPTPYPILRLITCTGDFDRTTHNYLNNLVVSAHLV